MVFEGRYHPDDGTTPSLCAVKVLNHNATYISSGLSAGEGPENAVKRFKRECSLLAELDHPNVVNYLTTTKHPKSEMIILAMELMDCNLRMYLEGEESLTTTKETSLSKDIASGLAYIHSKGIIHRDLCGENILLKWLQAPVPLAKISDFGMSRLYDSAQMSTSLTAIGHCVGYLPPEALLTGNEQYDHSLDVFSLGVLMIQIACKLSTIKKPKEREAYFREISHTHVLWSLISKCLHERPMRRPTAQGALIMLQECMLVCSKGKQSTVCC